MCRHALLLAPAVIFRFRPAFPFPVRHERSSWAGWTAVCLVFCVRQSCTLIWKGCRRLCGTAHVYISYRVWAVVTAVHDTYEITGRCAFNYATQPREDKALFTVPLGKLNAERRKAWINRTGTKYFNPTKLSKLCQLSSYLTAAAERPQRSSSCVWCDSRAERDRLLFAYKNLAFTESKWNFCWSEEMNCIHIRWQINTPSAEPFS